MVAGAEAEAEAANTTRGLQYHRGTVVSPCWVAVVASGMGEAAVTAAVAAVVATRPAAVPIEARLMPHCLRSTRGHGTTHSSRWGTQASPWRQRDASRWAQVMEGEQLCIESPCVPHARDAT